MHFIRFTFAATILGIAACAPASAQELTIGSVAPELDIEHWIQDGQGKFEPVTKFKKGNVYVVEFWATWCGPCIASMPHLAELQTKYADKSVQIVSISDEPLDTVTKFLEGNVRGKEMTYAELTRPYCLTTDPDRSSQVSYMEAAGQAGIPTSFLIGKDGHIEWIGHPMEMDEPLASVVAGTWDRAEFIAQLEKQKEIEAELGKIDAIARSGNFADAILKIDELLKNSAIDSKALAPAKQHISALRPIFVVLSGSAEGIALMKKDAEAAGDDWAKNTQVGLNAFRAFEMNKALPEPAGKVYLSVGLDAIRKADELRPDNLQILQAFGYLLYRNGEFEKAIEVQERFVDGVRGATKSDAEKLLAKMKKEHAAKKANE